MKLATFAIAASLAASGCATVIPGTQLEAARTMSASERCATRYYLAGMVVDSLAVAANIAFGERIDRYDLLLFIPVGLDAMLGSALQLGCHHAPPDED